MAQKTYTRINWQNDPSVNTPLSAENLNKMDIALNEIDNRVVDLMNGVSGSTFEGATQSTPGSKGLVPAPQAGEQNKVLRGDGTWGDAGHANTANSATNATNATNATVASKLGSTTVGSAAKPIYLNNGVPTPINGDVATTQNLTDGSVTKIGTASKGNVNTPVYINNGVPTPISYSIEKSVPANAQFTDTTYENKPAEEGSTAPSLVTAGDKWRWDHASGGASSAEDVSYDNTESGLESDDVQGAIDELAILADADQSIVAIWDKSPAIRAHAKDSYIHYNGVTYIVTSAIAIGDTLTVGTNIAVPTLEEGTVIYIPEVDGTFTADMVDYDNTTSGLSAADVQHAIDKVASDKQDKTLSNPIVVGGVSKTTVEDALGGLNSAKQDNLTLTTHIVTGNPLSFTTDSAQVASNANITFEPIQAGSGDPSPSNPRAISGYKEIREIASKKNICKDVTVGGYYNSAGSWETASWAATSDLIPVTSDAIYTSSIFDGNGTRLGGLVTTYWNGEKQHIGTQVTSATFQPPTDAKYVRIRNASDYGTYVTNNNFKFQLEVNSSATTYEAPDFATDIQIQLGDTLYGGSLDVESGELVVDKACVDLGDLSWIYSDGYFQTNTLNNKFVRALRTNVPSMLCSCYKVSYWDDTSDKVIISSPASSVPYQVAVKDTSYSNATTFKTAVTGQTLVYKLATPYTIQLPPAQVKLLQGANVVTTNGTSMSLTYCDGEIAKLSDLSGLADSVNAGMSVVKASNRNLLDNPWFTVNQRGWTSGSVIGYTVDRWKSQYGTATVAVVSNGIKLTTTSDAESFRQLLESIEVGKTYTLSVLMGDGTIHSGAITVGSTTQVAYSDSAFALRQSWASGVPYVDINVQAGKEVTVRAVKLELGSYSTLHLDTAPNYTTELLKCQRYFYRLQAAGPYKILATGYCETTTSASVFVTLPVGMRTIAQVTTSGTFSIYNGAVNKTATIGTTGWQTTDCREVMIPATATGLTAGQSAGLLASADAYIDFNAEL